jgi:hypothetical protein
MTESTGKEAGIIQALAERLEKQRLPMALKLKEKVDQGGLLNDADIAFLEEVFAGSAQLKPMLDAHPEWQELAARMTRLYNEITATALKNEQGAKPQK